MKLFIFIFIYSLDPPKGRLFRTPETRIGTEANCIQQISDEELTFEMASRQPSG